MPHQSKSTGLPYAVENVFLCSAFALLVCLQRTAHYHQRMFDHSYLSPDTMSSIATPYSLASFSGTVASSTLAFFTFGAFSFLSPPLISLAALRFEGPLGLSVVAVSLLFAVADLPPAPPRRALVAFLASARSLEAQFLFTPRLLMTLFKLS